VPRFYGDVLDVWRPWARQVVGRGIEGSHFLVEDRPEQVAELLSGFLRQPEHGLPTPREAPS
jgi:haloacetate dehalogenase